MTLWIQKGQRLDIELAVALEFGSVRLTRAHTEMDRQKAISFNRALWSMIGRLTATAPEVDYRDALRDGARAAASETPIELAARNCRMAGALAAKAATGGALSRMLDDWRNHRSTCRHADFGDWLLDRMEPEMMPLAA